MALIEFSEDQIEHTLIALNMRMAYIETGTQWRAKDAQARNNSIKGTARFSPNEMIPINALHVDQMKIIIDMEQVVTRLEDAL